MTPPKLPNWLIPSVLVCALVCSYSIRKRHNVEVSNRAVSICTEMENVEALAAAQGITIDKALLDLKAQGMNAVVLSENTVSDLIGEGLVKLSPNTIEAQNPLVRDLVLRGLTVRFPHLPPPAVDGNTLSIAHYSVRKNLIRGTVIGLDPRQVTAARAAGLGIVARISNPVGASADTVKLLLEWVRSEGAFVFLPQGDQVLGRRDALPTTVETLRATGMFYASAEFAKMGGDANMVETAPELTVRLHSAQVAELDKLPLAEAVERFSRAARERNMRLLLVRPLSLSAPEPLASFADYVKRISVDIEKQGGTLGAARPFEDSNVPKWAFLLIGVTTLPTAWFVICAFFTNVRVRTALFALFALAALACYSSVARAPFALVASMLFPLAAFLVLDGRMGRPVWTDIVREYVILSLISLVGGLCVAGLLNGLPYFIQAKQAMGIKLTVFGPLAVIGIYYFARLGNFRESFRSPVTWGKALLALVIVGALFFMASRTGNDNPAGVSSTELMLRNLMDRILFVRPRTKEFMVGHPAMVVAIGLLLWLKHRPDRGGIGGWTALAMVVGAIGQTSIVNTLCHLHTPFMLSLARIGMGLLAGCILGLVLWSIVRSLLPKDGETEIG